MNKRCYTNTEKDFYFINVAKYHIHKSKLFSNKPHFKVFFKRCNKF